MRKRQAEKIVATLWRGRETTRGRLLSACQRLRRERTRPGDDARLVLKPNPTHEDVTDEQASAIVRRLLVVE
jgi:hypothetical protein